MPWEVRPFASSPRPRSRRPVLRISRTAGDPGRPAGWRPLMAAMGVTYTLWASIGEAAPSSAAGSVGPRDARAAQRTQRRAAVRPWPCRLVAEPPLLQVIEDAWRRSPTFRRQCEELAAARAVVELRWGTSDSQSRAVTRMQIQDSVVVARVSVPPVREAAEHVAHELQHVIERVRGVNFAAESKRPGSGVWRAFGGFETQAAIDTGRQVARELASK